MLQYANMGSCIFSFINYKGSNWLCNQTWWYGCMFMPYNCYMAIIDCYHMLCQTQCCNYCCNDNNSFLKNRRKNRVKKEDNIKVVVEGDVVQKEEFVQVGGGGNFVVAIVIVALQR